VDIAAENDMNMRFGGVKDSGIGMNKFVNAKAIFLS